MQTAVVIVIALVALSGCASSSSRLDATEVCMRAGFQPQDKDYADCVGFTRQYRAETRRERMRQQLDIADHPAQQAGVKFFYNAPTLGRGP